MPHSAAAHTRGHSCRLAPINYPRPDPELEGIPPINAQFFYSSPIPIDDPLSAVTSTGSADAKSSKYPTRPFSQGDSNALERAWLALSSRDDRRNHAHSRRHRSPSPSLARSNAEKLAAIIQRLVAEHGERHTNPPAQEAVVAPTGAASGSDIPICCLELPMDASNELQKAFCALTRKRRPMLDQDRVVNEVMTRLRRSNSSLDASDPATRKTSSSVSSVASRRGVSVHPSLSAASALRLDDAADVDKEQAARRLAEAYVAAEIPGILTSDDTPTTQVTGLGPDAFGTPAAAAIPIPKRRPPVLDDGISGKPFVRVGSVDTPQSSAPASISRFNGSTTDVRSGNDYFMMTKAREQVQGNPEPLSESIPHSGEANINSVEIPVGISRLHMVTLPNLQMKPIYWSPVNDIAIVIRATWFYRDTMQPVEPGVANQLEAGYRELRPWTQTWSDELRCAVDVGPLGEEKVSHPLWPSEVGRGPTGKISVPSDPAISDDPFCAARCFHGEAAAEGSLRPIHGGDHAEDTPMAVRSYANYHVIYANTTAAFLLKPSLKPSNYYGRRPVAKIRRGATVGIPVTRGFDRQAWNAVHSKAKEQPPQEASSPLAGDEPEAGHGLTGCPGCRAEKKQGQVTDLVLVAHGVGQKLAERVESFHFTHAINAFRRSMNIELNDDAVRHVLRDGMNGIMVLPVNWRTTVSFDDGKPASEEDREGPGVFGLKDIEPDTIPAVRSMISDVMFDIPFYMSHHKPKMIKALITEANRVYRLWALNNPGFADTGRVHLIGHSLGSAMAIEVLSSQPTVSPPVDLTSPQQSVFFEFNTTNLFLLGSPAAFFLLLEQGKLIPRRGRLKPGADPGDAMRRDVVGETATFGCLAVDNIYNILAREDPIAYLLNGAVDPLYATSLRMAYVPSATTGLLASFGQALRGYVAGPDNNVPALTKPAAVRLPSQLELEVHDFTREEIAEKKAFLLNDNGQIDYFLRSGGGPLEIQYLNMLSAHTSYWTNRDLVRLLCVEIGRKPGKANSLPSMRAVKATKRFVRTRD